MTPWDLVKASDDHKANLKSFFLDVASWRKFDPGVPLSWQRVKFGHSPKEDVPTERGIYLFTIEVGDLGLPSHGYIMYFGITGNKSAANLRKRYAQYVRERDDHKGRPRVVYMLNKWRDDLVFNFMPVPDAAVDLAKIEKSFLNAVKPPVNSADFAAEIAAPIKATL